MPDLLFQHETYQIIGRCMEVHRILGHGLDEVVYKDALDQEFQIAAIPFERERKYEVTYKSVVLRHGYFADFVVFDKIILEAKAVQCLTAAHVKQLMNYLAIARLKVGLLVNFGESSLKYQRVVL